MKCLAVVWVGLLLATSALACGSDLSEQEIREKLAPSMVTFRTEFGRGSSGFLVEGNYVITAAHVVWPKTVANFVFDDGTEHTDVPVVFYDLMADLAILGPVERSAPGLTFATGGRPSEGSTAFSAGYPGEAQEFGVNKGEIWSVERWADADVTYLYTSAHGEAGMSGGPVTDGQGSVIGVLFGGGEDSWSAATSVSVIEERLTQVENETQLSMVGSRLPSNDEGSYEHNFTLSGRWDTETFVFDQSEETLVEIDFESSQDVEYAILHPQGWSFFEEFEGTTFLSSRSGSLDPYGYGGPAFIVVKQRFDLERAVTIKSSVPLVRHSDPDDGRELRIGDNIVGAFDTAVDIDRYTINLQRGQRVGLRFRSDPASPAVITVDYPDAPYYEVVSVDTAVEDRDLDGSTVLYRAPIDAEYTIAIRPSRLGLPSGYTLATFRTVSTNMHSRPPRPLNVDRSPVGDLLRYQSRSLPIGINYPLNVTGVDEDLLGATVFEQGRRGETVAIEELDLTFYGQGLPIDRYIRSSIVMNGLPLLSEQVTTRRELTTSSGAPVVIEDFEADEGQTKGVRLAYIHEGTTGFMAVFYAPTEVFDEWKSVVDYSIGTFAIFGETVVE